MNRTTKRVTVGAITVIMALIFLFLFYMQTSFFVAQYNELKFGENIVLFRGLDLIFYFIIGCWVIVSVFSKLQRFTMLGILIALFGVYMFFYDAISFKFIDLVASEHGYTLCLKKAKGHRAGFGSNYIFVRNLAYCERFDDFQNRSVTSRELEERVSQLKMQSSSPEMKQ